MSRQSFGRSLTLVTLTQACSISLCCLGSPSPAIGQISSDRTLGAQSSVIVPNINIKGIPSDRIDGGAIRGTSLFHSFTEFNIREGRGAYFTNPVGIENILSRVTGTNPSNILGRLGVLGNANLFLLNPNGIVFGSNAKLDVRGSFVASTASTLKLADGTFFSTTDPSVPPLLTISIPVGLQYRGNEGSIQLEGSRLSVPNRETLALVGGTVSLDSASLLAAGGRIELGGLAGVGTVGLNFDGNNWRLSFPDGITRSDVSLTRGSGVTVAAGGGGSITVNARNLDILEGSILNAGIKKGLGAVDAQAGNITVNATGEIKVLGGGILSEVQSGALGKGGDIKITTGSLSFTNGAQVSASNFGQGDAGNVTIAARDTIAFDGVGRDGISGGAFSSIGSTAMGKGGDVNITTGSLFLTNGALISSSSFGQGDAGSVTISARDTITFDGVGSNGFASGAFSAVGQRAVGKGGDVTVTTGSLFLTNGGQLVASTKGQGDAGSVTITARDAVAFDGIGNTGLPSGAFSNVSPTAVGKGGDVNITTDFLSLTKGALISAATFGRGDAGSVTLFAHDAIAFDGEGSNGIFNGAVSFVGLGAVGKGGDIKVTTGSLFLTNGAQVSAATRGQGDAGSVTITVRDTIAFDGVGRNGLSSGAFSNVGAGAVGRGGNVNLTAGLLSLTNGAQVNAAVTSATGTLSGGQGRGGNIQVASDSVNLLGVGLNGVSSGFFTSTGRSASGDAGNIIVSTSAFHLADGALVSAKTFNASDGGSITINAKTFEAWNGGQVLTSTSNNGKAGNINLKVTDNITLSGRDPTFDARFASFGSDTVTNESGVSGLFASTEANSRGNGGSIVVNPTELALTNGATISVSSLGTGNAGNIVVEANSILLDQGKLTAESTAGKGGDIQLKVRDLLLLRRNSLISAVSGTTGSDGRDGNINIDTQFLVAIPLENSDIVATGFGRSVGSNIQVNAKGIFGTQFREQLTPKSDIVATGTVTLSTPGVDPSQGLVALPEAVVDPATLIGQNPCERGKGSEFTVTGRGGLPPNPSDALNTDATQVSLVEPASSQNTPSTTSRKEPQTPPKTSRIVPAQGWVFNDKGQVVLTASNPISTGTQRPWENPAPCQAP